MVCYGGVRELGGLIIQHQKRMTGGRGFELSLTPTSSHPQSSYDIVRFLAPDHRLVLCEPRSSPTRATGSSPGKMSSDVEIDRLPNTLDPDTQRSAEDPHCPGRHTTGAPDDNPPSPQPIQTSLSTKRKTLLEAVRSCFSEQCPLQNEGQPYLSKDAALWNRNLSEVQLVSGMEDDNTMSTKLLPADLWTKLEDTTTEQAVIVVGNIDDEWCEALCTRFPQQINERFFLEHILGLTLSASCTCQDGISPICKAIAADVGNVVQLLSGRLDTPRGDVGFHINYWCESDTAFNSPRPAEGCMLRRAWERIRSYEFISCCQVGARICECRC
jgi:hypothetical protein